MDQKVLVDELIVDGEKLLRQLVEEGYPITAAGWLKEPEWGQWHLYIATPLADKDLRAAYGRMHTIRREMPEELSLDISGARLVGPDDPVTRRVLEAPREKSGRNRLHFGEGGIRFGGVDVEEAYLYPLEGAPA